MIETETACVNGLLWEVRPLNILLDCEADECENEDGKPEPADYELLSRELDHDGLTVGVLHLCEECLMKADPKWGQ